MAVIIETSIGELTVDLYSDERPRCSKNFLKLCKVKYYNFCLFHSVQPNLVAQTGDPTATGRGGMSVYGMVYGDQASYFDMEVTPRIKHKKRGLLSMVNNGNGRHGSQFFITLGADLDYLDGEHTVFGEVAEGFEVLDKLNEAYCDDKHRPYRDIRIFHTVIVDDPFDDPEGLVIPDKSPEPTKEMLESDRIGVDEEVDDTKGMTEKEIQELQETREAKANAQLLEMVGDIPDEDVKPPDNVLFVCKLNPVTTDEDLEMIFSRFGPIVSCEVIKDHKTKESLQYAFVEFEKPEHCENAYFKMDNVLIDDRRIHVDFSQSVSKLRMPMASGKKAEEEKKVDQPKYVLKDQQRQDNNYDLVFEHDLPEKSPERKKSKKHKHRKLSNSDEDGDAKGRKKARRQGEGSRSESRSRSPQGRERDGTVADRVSDDQPHTQRREKERERRRSSSSQEDRRKERKRDRKTSPTEEGSKKERKKERKRSPSLEEDRKKEKRRKERSPSSDKDRKKHKKRKERSPSSEQDKRQKRKNRSPSTEEDRRKKKKRSTSSDEDRKKKKKEKRSSSEDRKKERRRKERSPSPKEDRRKKKKERRHSSSEEDDSKERKKEGRRRGDYSSSSYRDRGDRDRR